MSSLMKQENLLFNKITSPKESGYFDSSCIVEFLKQRDIAHSDEIVLILEDVPLKQAWEELRNPINKQKLITFIHHKQLSDTFRIWRNVGNAFRYASTATATGSIILCSNIFYEPILSKSLAIASLLMNGIYWTFWKSNVFFNYYPIAKFICDYVCKKNGKKPSEIVIVDYKQAKHCGYRELLLSGLALLCSFDCTECKEFSLNNTEDSENKILKKLQNFFKDLLNGIILNTNENTVSETISVMKDMSKKQ